MTRKKSDAVLNEMFENAYKINLLRIIERIHC